MMHNVQVQTQQLLLVASEVLIVEDTPASLTLLSDLMHQAGYAVRQAQDGELAIASVQNRLPDLILLDIWMPGIDGFEVCRRLKSSPATAGVPIVFLSALDDIDARIQGLRLGAVDYIVKPYEPDEVLLRVKTQLELHNLQHHLSEMCSLRTHELQIEVEQHQKTMQELFESKQLLRELSSHLEQIREDERARIAREIHDELGQTLTVTRIELTRMLQKLDEPKEGLQERIQNTIKLVEQSADTARTISENLRPGMLDLLGLEAAIKHHVSQFRQSTGISCQVTIDNQINVDNKIATIAYRVIQESLTNVARHANAKNVNVQIADLGNELVVIVQDDGQGFVIGSDDIKQGSYGLLGMSERVQSLGGSLLIDSTKDNGTRIEANLPYERNKESQ